MRQEDIGHNILQRLNIIICLLLDASAADNAASVASKVHKLGDLGLTPAEIAKILGKPVNYVTAVKATKRAREGKQ